VSKQRARRGAWVGLLVTVGLVLGACAGGSSGVSQPAPAPPSAPAPGTIGAGEITGPLQGAALVRGLRGGGLLLWMRHTERDDRSGTVTPLQAASLDCAARSALTATGRQHATQIGAALRGLDLPIAAVRTARLCRTQDTGRLAIAAVTDDDRLDASSTWADRGGGAEQQATLGVLAEQSSPGTDVVLVSSALGIPQAQPAVLGALGPGETAVFGPGPVGKATLLARIGESAWPTLLQAATTIPFTPSR
jgi:hypothetical protein